MENTVYYLPDTTDKTRVYLNFHTNFTDIFFSVVVNQRLRNVPNRNPTIFGCRLWKRGQMYAT